MTTYNEKAWINIGKARIDIIDNYIKLHPDRSNSWISSEVGYSIPLIKKRRELLENSREIAKYYRLWGKNMKSYPKKND